MTTKACTNFSFCIMPAIHCAWHRDPTPPYSPGLRKVSLSPASLGRQMAGATEFPPIPPLASSTSGLFLASPRSTFRIPSSTVRNLVTM